MARTFVALELSDGIRERLHEAQQVLRGCSARLTFVEPALIHLTVKFLGEVDEKQIVQVQDVLEKIRVTPFTVTAGNVTVNNLKRPHTVWCAFDDGGNGERLLGLIEEGLVPLGFARETRRYTPHATIARVKSPDASLIPAIAGIGDVEGSCTIGGMKLKKSTLTPRGPVYEDLLEVKW